MAETLAEKLEKSELGHWMHRFEGFMVLIGIVGPFATLPQLIKLYFTHSQHATGQSLLSWRSLLCCHSYGSPMGW